MAGCALLLNWDRAARRAEWIKWKKEKELRDAEMKQERERQQRVADEAEVKRQRQQTVHHARPVPRFVRQQKPAAEWNMHCQQYQFYITGNEVTCIDIDTGKILCAFYCDFRYVILDLILTAFIKWN